MKSIAAIHLLTALFAAAGLHDALAADYPERPVRVINTFGAPGGAPDVISRTIGAKLTHTWGVQVVIDPRPGAAGLLATEIASKASPDGYTLLLVSPSHAINPALYPKIPYDPVKDFLPITQVAEVPNIVSVYPGLGVHSVRELIALAKAKPGTLSYGSAGIGSSQHLAGELFREMAHIDIVHVPYKVASATNIDLIAGRIQLAFASTTSVQHIRAGRLTGLAVTSARRNPALPDLPTVAEAGLPGYEAASWYGLLAPARTPRTIIGKLHADFVKAAQAPEVKQQLAPFAIESSVSSSPAEFGAFLERERVKWSELVRRSGAKVE